IHNFSPRKHNRYIAVNCGAIPEGTIDSELFGHEKGAFTGAIGARKGDFEEADGGTLFLDEVAELPLTTQARLLRVLESGEFLKVGSSTVQKTNVRIVAATNVDMLEAVASGRFREDLYYRLSTVQISVPPLRDRGSDIMLLARKFARDFSERYSMPAISFSDEARALMLHYRWPGNVRQLKNVVEQLALFHPGTEIDRAVIEVSLPAAAMSYTPAPAATSANNKYEQEREALLNMLFGMQRELDAIRGELEELKQGSAAEVKSVDMPCSLVKYTEPTGGLLNFSAPAESDESQPMPTLEETERESIRLALEKSGGRRREAARALNISERTLYRKIKEYGLD
ncbi:MAG: sigma-54 dependent transcriptional regulator, partial [Paramuribaculum sp.]|nr:sigma-54 dependent transcriptional regulator [Paramuribaculum sp.]